MEKEIQKLKTVSRKLLVMKVHTKRNFNYRLKNILRKPSLKINALLRVISYITLSEKVIFTNSFLTQYSVTALFFGCFLAVS